VRNLILIVGIIGRYFVGKVLFDLLSLCSVKVLVGPDPINVTHANQIVDSFSTRLGGHAEIH